MTLGLTAWTRPSTANPQSLSLQQTWTCSWAWSPAQLASQVALEVSAGDVRDMGSIPGLGRSPGGGHGNPFQYSYLENPMDRGAWQAIVHGVMKSWTWLSMRKKFEITEFGVGCTALVCQDQDRGNCDASWERWRELEPGWQQQKWLDAGWF